MRAMLICIKQFGLFLSHHACTSVLEADHDQDNLRRKGFYRHLQS